ncbi:glutathione S-transferase family protein [Ahrensia sp. R2A130]|uniref:glutathione S-transferase family protein n=1 Tax=Ahrensia sp. R2A130 TaxID=744979 RepID=UPI0001E083FE|nr:glutathione binding-like protein [Ahrensia sp. R2A130]EFL88497.1 glutathione S-transferase family protein [Ahrensia sp. R2A130]
MAETQKKKTLADFPITERWTPKNPDVLQLFSFPTPNGVKVSIALEELGVPYEAHTVKLNETETSEFLSLNPNNKIPAIIDPTGANGEAMGLWESGAILIYLAEKHGGLLPTDPAAKAETIQWLMFQMGGVGPMFGQFGFFHAFAGKEIDDPRPKERYQNEAKRLLKVLEQRLQGRQWIMDDDYTIADIAIFPWIRGAKIFYKAEDELALNSFPAVMAWLDRCVARSASKKGLTVPDRDG